MSLSQQAISNAANPVTRIPSSERRSRAQPESLLPHEELWRDIQPWLQDQGYQLRPRYHKDWVPTWIGKKGRYWDYEDHLFSRRRNLLDAIRVQDGEMVALKSIQKNVHPYEVEITTALNEGSLRSSSSNHCVPIFQVLNVPETDTAILVMPLLRQFDDPPFETVGETVEFFRQIFEGMRFIHGHHIAHRDCMGLNIMMDPRPMYPDMYHPRATNMDRQYKRKAKFFSRTARPVKYYFIDFGISRRYDADNTSPREDPIWGGDKSVPEFQDSDDPQDPFPTDIYYLGNMIRTHLLQKTHGLEFMTSLVDDMTQDDPRKRPNIAQVVDRFDTLMRSLSWFTLRRRLIYGTESISRKMIRTTTHAIHTSIHILSGRRAVPTPTSELRSLPEGTKNSL